MPTVSPKRHLLTAFALTFLITLAFSTLIFSKFQHLQSIADITDRLSLRAVDEPSPNYLHEEEIIVIENIKNEEIILPVEKVLFEYIEIKDSCDVHFVGDCVLARSGPGTDFESVLRLRDHVVLKIGGKVENGGRTWYKIVFDEYIRYPERIKGDLYVASEFVDVLLDEGEKFESQEGSASSTKVILVDRSEQKLYASEGEEVFMETAISTGLELTPTPRGTFTVFKKTPSRYMQGPLPGFTDSYDLPGVPWNLYFTHQGAVIHGAYWHDSFGSPYSHGCVNLSPEDARKLYTWADLGTKIIVRD